MSNLIPPRSSVVDICCGTCQIYKYLRMKNIHYIGIDFNSIFIKNAQKKGIDCRMINIKHEEIPKADFIIIQGSLYQFIPDHISILEKLFYSANRALIIAEPIKNHIQSNSKAISYLSRLLNNPGDGIKDQRFTVESLKKSIEKLPHNGIQEYLTPRGIEYIAKISRANNQDQ